MLTCCGILLLTINLKAQKADNGILTATVFDPLNKPVGGATVILKSKIDSTITFHTTSESDGSFLLDHIPMGLFTIFISHINASPLSIDSIFFRKERNDFNLGDIVLKAKNNTNLQEVIVYAEKPLISSKEGNITFNVAESALSAGSNAGELLANVPLVTKDPNGKVLVRGKEPKILIDDKPVELNMQQLQDLLESMPGSSIEKIEVMTNPPPQYANEQGGVINISLKKGKLTKTGRIAFSTGSRGEEAVSANYTYKKNKLSINANGGIGFSKFKSNSISTRTNIYTDSTTKFSTTSNNRSNNLRPNGRLGLDYDFSKNSNLSIALQYFQGDQQSKGNTQFENYNAGQKLYKLSTRSVYAVTNSYSPGFTAGYVLRSKKPGQVLRITTGYNYNYNKATRDYLQSFLNPDRSPTGKDSTSTQVSNSTIHNMDLRLNYDKPIVAKKTFLSIGGYIIYTSNHTLSQASYLDKTTQLYTIIKPLLNDFIFNQSVINERASIRQIFLHKLVATIGTSLEHTRFHFTFNITGTPVKNGYDTWLPFANISKIWARDVSATFSYRRTIRRPGIVELNPTIDVTDPYNIRYGNANLQPSTVDNFDAVIGKAKTGQFMNMGIGYNRVKNIFSQIRTLLDSNRTQRTYENISGRQEYEISTWNGYTISKMIKVNLSASYIFNQYSQHDKVVNRYRDGASITSNFSITIIPNDVWNIAGSFNLNKFASPQGYARWNTSMNISAMRRLLNKRLSIGINLIDPLLQQKNASFTYGAKYTLETYGITHTRNFRLNISYNLTKPPKKKIPLPKRK